MASSQNLQTSSNSPLALKVRPASLLFDGKLGNGCQVNDAYRPESLSAELIGSDDQVILQIKSKWDSQIKGQYSCGSTILRIAFSGQIVDGKFIARDSTNGIGVYIDEAVMGEIPTELDDRTGIEILTGPTISKEMARGFLEEFFEPKEPKANEIEVVVNNGDFLNRLGHLVFSQVRDVRDEKPYAYSKPKGELGEVVPGLHSPELDLSEVLISRIGTREITLVSPMV